MTDLKESKFQMQVRAECGRVASTIIAIEKKRIPDEMCGMYDTGLMAITDDMHFHSINSISYETEARKGRQNCGYMTIPLMVYYVKDEFRFKSWYQQQSHHTESHVRGPAKQVVANAIKAVLKLKK